MKPLVTEKTSSKIQLFYSLLLIVLIPALIILNVYLIWRSVKSNMDNELHQKAILANEIFATLATRPVFEDKSVADKTLESVSKQADEVSEISLIVKGTDNYTVFASTNASKRDTIISGYQADIAWKENQPVATLGTYQDKDGKMERIWSVTSLVTIDGVKVGLIDTKVSLLNIDTLIDSSLRQSMMVLIATLLVIVMLLINHFRFFESAQLVRKLQEVDKMKDDFISIASHELKTPVAAIRGYLANITDGVGGVVDEKAKANIMIVDKQAIRLNELVNDLLNVSRLEQGRLQFELAPTDMKSVIDEVVSNLSIQTQEKGLKLNYIPVQNPLIIMADPARLREIFTNVIGNAIKYTLQGEVTISHTIENEKIKTVVKDSGVGMSAEARKSLFTKFYRIKSDKTQDIPGTGLGLWITKEMVEKMKGEIFVDSMENVGSQFTIVFPLTKNQPAAPVVAAPADPSVPSAIPGTEVK